MIGTNALPCQSNVCEAAGDFSDGYDSKSWKESDVMKLGLVLEGGGMRGLYTGGVLEYLMDQGLWADYCIGVSAGACHGVSYVSRQRGRNLRINTEYVTDPRYVGIRNFIRTGSVFGMDFIFDEIPHKLDPFDYESFLHSDCQFIAGVTDAETGKPVYFGREDMRYTSVILRASSSIPAFAPPVEYKGKYYFDGGTSDPIPFAKALKDGCDRIIVVPTRQRGYHKPPERGRALYRKRLKDYPAMIALLDRRHEIYNSQLAELKRLEQAGTALIIGPETPLEVGRFEKDVARLKQTYARGYADAEAKASELKAFFGR